MGPESCWFYRVSVRASPVMLSPRYVCSAPCAFICLQVTVTLPWHTYFKAHLTQQACLQKHSCPTLSDVSHPCLVVLAAQKVSHGHRSQSLACDTSHTDKSWPTRWVYFYLSLPSSLAVLRIPPGSPCPSPSPPEFCRHLWNTPGYPWQ